MGLPASSAPDSWLPLRRVVAGRVVSCYRPGDLVLTLVHRANTLGYGIAGLEPVLAPGVESIDVSAVVKGHSKYRLTVGRVLKLVDLEETEPEVDPASTLAAPEAAPAPAPAPAAARAPASAAATQTLSPTAPAAGPAAAASGWRGRLASARGSLATQFASTGAKTSAGAERREAEFI